VAGVEVLCAAILPIVKSKNTVPIGYFITDTVDEYRRLLPIGSDARGVECPSKVELLRRKSVRNTFLVVLWLCSAVVFGQNTIPAGTILPLRLNSALNSKKSKAGQAISATLMQDVPLAPQSTIHAGTKVMGHVVDVIPATTTSGARISFRFDTIEISKQKVPITTNLRALASMMEVHEAQLPQSGPDRGTSENAWTTVQIGGDVVYRGGGPVAHGLEVVGTPTAKGVLCRVRANTSAKCRGETDGNDLPQALWVFSADACGAYGFPDLTIIHAGRSSPFGEVALGSTRGDFEVRSGSGMLLRVSKG